MTLDDSAASLSNSSYLKFIMSLHTVSAALGIVSMSIMKFRRRPKRLLAHKSLLLLLHMHSFWILLVCATTFFNNSSTLYAHLTMRVPSDLLVSPWACSLRRVISVSAVYGFIFSQMAMAAERYRASASLGVYENSSSSSGHLLNAAHVSMALLVSFVHLGVTGFDSTPVPHCTLVRFTGDRLIFAMVFFLFLCELATIVTFVRLFVRNIRLKDNCEAGLTLTERYQLAENIRMLKILLPIFCHSALGLFGSTFFLTAHAIFPNPDVLPMIELTANLLHLQGIFIPIIFESRLRQERLASQRVLSINAKQGEELAEQYTKEFARGW